MLIAAPVKFLGEARPSSLALTSSKESMSHESASQVLLSFFSASSNTSLPLSVTYVAPVKNTVLLALAEVSLPALSESVTDVLEIPVAINII
jgi:hypothetical protein